MIQGKILKDIIVNNRKYLAGETYLMDEKTYNETIQKGFKIEKQKRFKK